jgi:hypothetical protein
VFRRIRAVEDSAADQHFLEPEAVKWLRKLLLRRGTTKFGAPTKKAKTAIEEVEDLPRLCYMMARLAKAKSWNGVLESRSSSLGANDVMHPSGKRRRRQ